MLRAGAFQILWALLLVYFILLGIAFLFGREVGYEISFGVSIGLAILVTVSFLAIYVLDRMTAAGSEWMEKYRERKKHNHADQRNSPQ
jgi:hypothetical protein